MTVHNQNFVANGTCMNQKEFVTMTNVFGLLMSKFSSRAYSIINTHIRNLPNAVGKGLMNWIVFKLRCSSNYDMS